MTCKLFISIQRQVFRFKSYLLNAYLNGYSYFQSSNQSMFYGVISTYKPVINSSHVIVSLHSPPPQLIYYTTNAFFSRTNIDSTDDIRLIVYCNYLSFDIHYHFILGGIYLSDQYIENCMLFKIYNIAILDLKGNLSNSVLILIMHFLQFYVFLFSLPLSLTYINFIN